jgi:hypothetical protein
MRFDYTKVNRPDTYKHKCSSTKPTDAAGNNEGVDCSQNACETFKDCPGSIKINGSYVVALYSRGTENNGGALHCQTFTQDVENLDAEQIGAEASESGGKLDYVDIIPIK